MTIASRFLVSIGHLKQTFFFRAFEKTDAEHPTPCPMLSSQKIPLISIKNTRFTIFVLQHKLIQWSTFRMKVTVKIGAECQKWSHSHPQASPSQTEQQKRQKYKNNFSSVTKNGPMVNIPITFDKEKVEIHTQTFDNPYENSCPVDLRPKQASYSNLTQNYDTSKNHSDGHRTTFSNTNQQNIVANNTPTASPLVPYVKTSKTTRRIISSSLGKVFDPLGLVTSDITFENFISKNMGWYFELG